MLDGCGLSEGVRGGVGFMSITVLMRKPGLLVEVREMFLGLPGPGPRKSGLGRGHILALFHVVIKVITVQTNIKKPPRQADKPVDEDKTMLGCPGYVMPSLSLSRHR